MNPRTEFKMHAVAFVLTIVLAILICIDIARGQYKEMSIDDAVKARRDGIACGVALHPHFYTWSTEVRDEISGGCADNVFLGREEPVEFDRVPPVPIDVGVANAMIPALFPYFERFANDPQAIAYAQQEGQVVCGEFDHGPNCTLTSEQCIAMMGRSQNQCPAMIAACAKHRRDAIYCLTSNGETYWLVWRGPSGTLAGQTWAFAPQRTLTVKE